MSLLLPYEAYILLQSILLLDDTIEVFAFIRYMYLLLYYKVYIPITEAFAFIRHVSLSVHYKAYVPITIL